MSLKYPALLAFIFLKSFTQKVLQRLLKVYNDNKKIKIKKKSRKSAHCVTTGFSALITYNFIISGERAFIKTVIGVIKFKLTVLWLWLKILLTTGQ